MDGLTEYQNLNILQEMTMSTTTYKINNSNNTTITQLNISRFIGQLKG